MTYCDYYSSIYAKKYTKYLFEQSEYNENTPKAFLTLARCSFKAKSFIYDNIREIEFKLFPVIKKSDDAYFFYCCLRKLHLDNLIYKQLLRPIECGSTREMIQRMSPSEHDVLDAFCHDYIKERGALIRFRCESRSNPAYYAWNGAVKLRDNFTCQCCGSTENLVAHHIRPVQYAPEFITDINNGITLCEKCHYKYHQKAGKKYCDYLSLNAFLNTYGRGRK